VSWDSCPPRSLARFTGYSNSSDWRDFADFSDFNDFALSLFIEFDDIAGEPMTLGRGNDMDECRETGHRVISTPDFHLLDDDRVELSDKTIPDHARGDHRPGIDLREP